MEFSVKIYSPRWGHDDNYTITLENNQLKITAAGARNCICKYDAPTDTFTWDSNYESLIRIFRNDLIEAPECIYEKIEDIWKAFIQERHTADTFQENFKKLAEWISIISKNKPNFGL